jgi:L-asparaginase/Glu-tRNA(Gln) amidotransferase subunit D/carbon monoxide dehydrogenase subunit G
MKVEKTFTVSATQDQVWSFITDPQRVAPCIPGCEGAEEKDPGKYAAAINLKVGPIQTTFHVDIEQTERRPPEFASYLTRGEEGGRASRVSGVSTLALRAVSVDSTEVTYASDINIVGRLGKFGSGMMQKIADNLGEEFVAALKGRLESPAVAEALPPTRREIKVAANWVWWAVGIGLGIALLLWWLLTSPARAQDREHRPRVMFLTTGGTIQNQKNPDGSNSRIPLEQTIANIRSRYPQPEVAAILDSIQSSFTEVTLVGSASFDVETEFFPLSLAAQKAFDSGYDAIIVTQGTFSSEFTCFFMNLLVNSDKPIIVTNAQRQHMSVGNDGDRNLLDSILVARHPDAVGKGAMLVEGSKIVSCRDVTKNSDRPGAFNAQSLGVMGFLSGGTLNMDAAVGDNVVFYYAPVRKHTHRSAFSIMKFVNADGSFRTLPRVEILPSQYSARPDVVEALVEMGVKGIVLQGLAFTGTPFATQREALDKLAESGMPIVRTHINQVVHDGRQVEPASGFYIGGDNLPAHKARILLQLAMVNTEGLPWPERRNAIQAYFSTH